MSTDLVALLYLVAGVLFILALRGLSSPETSRRGNLFGMVGMAIAILTTLAWHPPAGIGAWVLVAAGAVTGPLLLGAGQWAAGAIATLVGAVVVVTGVRSLHGLARRWLVLVPTGMVLHDPLTMPEPQLFLRQTMARLGPAPAVDPTPELDTEDLTAGASGLVVELVLSEPVELLVHAWRREAETRPVDRVLFVPVLPAVLVAEGRSRRLPVG